MTNPLARRDFLMRLLALPAALVALVHPALADEAEAARALYAASTPGRGSTARPTPDCDDGDDPTPSQTEGPFFTPRSPERASLIESGMAGERIVLEGFVVDTSCRPVAGALVDFWHADDAGDYDNEGYRLRGHQFTDAAGRWRLVTIVPGQYPGRTRHYHVKVQRPKGRVLTTQLYFPGERRNQRDGLFDRALLLATSGAGRERVGRFNFVLRG